MNEDSIYNYLSTTSTMSTHTAKEYGTRLNSFRKFVLEHYDDITMDDLIEKIRKGSENPYNILNNYA
ncbi:MAG: site-specific integrase, partial [Nitrososphaeraceae archaeon]